MELTGILEFLALLLGFYMAWNIGANDVANAMGTSVGSKALTIGKAVFIAAILEFSGAFFAGSSVSETIQKGIIDPSIFALDPNIFVLGMLASLLSTSIVLQIASYYALPVSTTHAIVGSVLGFGLFVGGFDAVMWAEVGEIILSWVISPVLSGVISFLMFSFIEKYILRGSKPIHTLQILLSTFVFVSVSFSCMTFVYPALIATSFSFPLLASLTSSVSVAMASSGLSFLLLRKLSVFALVGIDNPSDSIEKTFVYMQIVSACLVAFGHGANDVSNAIGPVAAVLTALKTQVVSSKSEISSWLLAFGGLGIVVGLATWGWRVIETVGKKITELTPSRGFSAEFGTASTVLLASKLGLPISTTHALVGAVVGVGLVRGLHSLNFSLFKGILISWVTTLPLCSVLCVIVFHLLKLIFI